MRNWSFSLSKSVSTAILVVHGYSIQWTTADTASSSYVLSFLRGGFGCCSAGPPPYLLTSTRPATTPRRYNTQAPHANNSTAAPAPMPIPAAAPTEIMVLGDSAEFVSDCVLAAELVAVVWVLLVWALLALYQRILVKRSFSDQKADEGNEGAELRGIQLNVDVTRTAIAHRFAA